MKIALTTLKVVKTGGISRYVVELADRFRRQHEVHIITSSVEQELEGVVMHKKSILWKPISLQVGSAALAYTREAKKLKQTGEVDLIHGQGAEVIDPDVVTAHSCQLAAVEQFKRERGIVYQLLKPLEPRNRIVLAIERHNMREGNHSKVIAVSGNVKEDLMRYYGVPEEDIEVVYNGVNIEEFNPEKMVDSRPKVRGELGIGAEDIVAVFSGWEFKRKGLMQIVQAMPDIKDLHVMVVGGDDPSQYMTQARKLKVADRLHFTGRVADISRYYAAADFMLFPTSYEPFGLVITEAMATGIPVIASRCAGAAEVITDGSDGLLLEDPQSPGEIAEKTNYLIQNNLIDKMGSRARQTAEKYSWSKIAERTLKVYGEALG